MPPKASLCVLCKGTKKLCGLEECPLLARARGMLRTYVSVVRSKDVSGMTPPSSIVGERGYPNVAVLYNIAPSGSGDNPSFYDDPKSWHGKLDLKGIVEMRSNLLSGVLRVPASDPWRLYEGEISLALVSLKPVDSEVQLKKPPVLQLSFDSVVRPVGLLSPLERVRVSSSPKVDRDLERMIWDDVRAGEALVELYMKGKDVYLLERALSLGLLGAKRRRKLVPTRWAITAVDDSLSDYLRSKILGYETVGEILLYRGEYLHNRFLIALIPGSYEGYWIEVWYPRSIWALNSSEPEIGVVRENQWGEVSHMDGGYSAARLAVLEHLHRIRRKAKFIILREVLPEYIVPVGNWHIRETVRAALSSDPVKVRDLKELLSIVESSMLSREAADEFKRALREMLSQRSLDEYLVGKA